MERLNNFFQDDEFFRNHDAQKIEKPGGVHIDLHLGAFEVKPLGPNKIHYRALAHANPNFGWVPDSVINFAIRKVIIQTCSRFLIFLGIRIYF